MRTRSPSLRCPTWRLRSTRRSESCCLRLRWSSLLLSSLSPLLQPRSPRRSRSSFSSPSLRLPLNRPLPSLLRRRRRSRSCPRCSLSRPRRSRRPRRSPSRLPLPQPPLDLGQLSRLRSDSSPRQSTECRRGRLLLLLPRGSTTDSRRRPSRRTDTRPHSTSSSDRRRRPRRRHQSQRCRSLRPSSTRSSLRRRATCRSRISS